MRVFAAMANRAEVRAALPNAASSIPAATWFLGAEHNTGDESIAWFDLPPCRPPARRISTRCSAILAKRRAATPSNAAAASYRRRSAPSTAGRGAASSARASHDWSQARPELGHATVATAFIGRRAMSRGTFSTAVPS